MLFFLPLFLFFHQGNTLYYGASVKKLNPRDGSYDDYENYFGWSVAIDGDSAIVGAVDETSTYESAGEGGAYMYNLTDLGWIQYAKLEPSDRGTWPETYPEEGFGYSVAIDGDYAAVGAPYHNEGTGAVYVFRRVGNSWVEEQILTGDVHDFFGSSVGISGDYLIVGAESYELMDFDPPFEDIFRDAGKAYIFKMNVGIWQEMQILTDHLEPSYSENYYGKSVKISGDRAIVGAPESGSQGRAFIYSRVGETWNLEKTIANGGTYAHFGMSVDIDEDYVIVGASMKGANYAGAAYTYHWSGSDWLLEGLLQNPNRATQDQMGISVGISKNGVALVGERWDDDPPNSGSAYIFLRQPDTSWLLEWKLKPNDLGVSHYFGYSVAVDKKDNLYSFVSAHRGGNDGTVYAFPTCNLGGNFYPTNDFGGNFDINLCDGTCADLWIGGLCDLCPANFYFPDTYDCLPCDDVSKGIDKCTKCSGSFLGGDLSCSECSEGYFPDDDSCLPCNDDAKGWNNCIKCSGSFIGDDLMCTECVAGYFSLYCNTSCEGNCGDDGCDYNDGTLCKNCVDGWYDLVNGCDKPCDGDYGGGLVYYCEPNQCDETSGFCVGGCSQNLWYGDRCDLPCSSGGRHCTNDECLKDGNCLLDCQHNWYGLQCDLCDVVNSSPGTCELGVCSEDFYGMFCDECDVVNPALGTCTLGSCAPGFFGTDCSCLEDCSAIPNAPFICKNSVCVKCFLPCENDTSIIYTTLNNRCVEESWVDSELGTCVSGRSGGWCQVLDNDGIIEDPVLFNDIRINRAAERINCTGSEMGCPDFYVGDLSGETVRSFCANKYLGIAIDSKFQTYIWGDANKNDYLGTSTNSPKLITSFESVKASKVVCTDSSVFVLSLDGKVYGMGKNLNSELGCHSYDFLSLRLEDVFNVFASKSSVYAQMLDTSFKAIGGNGFGSLGVGFDTTQVDTWESVVGISSEFGNNPLKVHAINEGVMFSYSGNKHFYAGKEHPSTASHENTATMINFTPDSQLQNYQPIDFIGRQSEGCLILVSGEKIYGSGLECSVGVRVGSPFPLELTPSEYGDYLSISDKEILSMSCDNSCNMLFPYSYLRWSGSSLTDGGEPPLFVFPVRGSAGVGVSETTYTFSRMIGSEVTELTYQAIPEYVFADLSHNSLVIEIKKKELTYQYAPTITLGTSDELKCKFPGNVNDQTWLSVKNTNGEDFYRMEIEWNVAKDNCGWTKTVGNPYTIFTNEIFVEEYYLVKNFNNKEFVRSEIHVMDIDVMYETHETCTSTVTIYHSPLVDEINPSLNVESGSVESSSEGEDGEGTGVIVIVVETEYPYIVVNGSVQLDPEQEEVFDDIDLTPVNENRRQSSECGEGSCIAVFQLEFTIVDGYCQEVNEDIVIEFGVVCDPNFEGDCLAGTAPVFEVEFHIWTTNVCELSRAKVEIEIGLSGDLVAYWDRDYVDEVGDEPIKLNDWGYFVATMSCTKATIISSEVQYVYIQDGSGTDVMLYDYTSGRTITGNEFLFNLDQSFSGNSVQKGFFMKMKQGDVLDIDSKTQSERDVKARMRVEYLEVGRRTSTSRMIDFTRSASIIIDSPMVSGEEVPLFIYVLVIVGISLFVVFVSILVMVGVVLIARKNRMNKNASKPDKEIEMVNF